MRTISLLSQKGGTGKTTIACHLATAFTKAGYATALLDLDPQRSSAEWGETRKSEFPHVQAVPSTKLKATADQLRSIACDILILDTAPHSEATALDAAKMSDLILIPCQPSILDIRAMRTTIDLLKLINVPAFALMNRIQHHSLQTAQAAEETIQKHIGVPVVPIGLGERSAFRKGLIHGLTAQEAEPASKAASETQGLFRWIERQMKVKEAA